MTPFLDKIAARLIDKFSYDMSSVAVVLPSKRAKVFLKHYISKKINRPIFLPELFSIEEFVEKISNLEVLDNISLQFRLYKTYLKNPPKKVDSFDDFLKWSSTLLYDFNEIDKSLVDASSIYTNLSDIKKLESWSIDNWSFSNSDLTVMQNDYINFYEGILKWYNDFSSSLLSENLAYQGLAYKQAANSIQSMDKEWSRIWFVGLNALTKSEQVILDFLKNKNIARVFWDADKYYYENEMHEAGSFLREQRSKWSEIDFDGVGNYFKSKKNSFNIISCPRNISQAKVASEILSSLEEIDVNESNTALVLSDESLLYPVLHNLPSSISMINVTMGNPLKGSSLFSFFEVLFDIHLNALKYKHDGFHIRDIKRLIQHAYFNLLVNSEAIESFNNYTNERNIVFINKIAIDNIFKNQLLTDIFQNDQNPKDFVLLLVNIIEEIRPHVLSDKASVESEIFATFYRSLNIINNLLDQSQFDFELKTLHVIMQQLVAKESIPFKGEPLKGLQIMGILESRTLDFDNVIMLSVNEGKLPTGKSVNSFIPYDLKKYFKLPTYSERDAVFAYHFYRLLQRAKNVSLIYNSETDDFGNGEKSRFITQLLAEYDGKINEYVYDRILDNKIQINQHIIKNDGLKEQIKLWAKKGVSPSALNLYNNCSLHFYYHYLADIKINDELTEHSDERTIGNAIHNTLDDVYPLGKLNKDFIKKNKDKIINNLILNFEKLMPEGSVISGKNYLNLEIAKKLINNFLKFEEKQLKKASSNNKDLNILAKEDTLDYKIECDGIDFNLIGTIDRIDHVGDEIRIIDYKTGKVDPMDLVFYEYEELINGSKPKALQLMMYAYLYYKNAVHSTNKKITVANISFKNIQTELIYLSRAESRKKSYPLIINEDVINIFEKIIIKVLLRIIREDFVKSDDYKFSKW